MFEKSKNGITLIALIITIIVLLILAGVSLNAVVGDNGILKQAQKSKIENQKGTAIEMISDAWNACEADYNIDISISKGKYFTIENLNKYLKGTGIVTELKYNENGTSTLKYTTYSDKNQYQIEIPKIGKIEVVGEISVVDEVPSVLPKLVDKVNSNKSAYYGKKVSGYEANGISDWRIFYSDNERVYLITTDYLPTNKIPSTVGMSTTGTYGIGWTSFEVTSLNNEYSRFMFGGMSNISTSNNNYKAAASLLDCSKWSAFVDNTKADYAIGSPTVEMWVDSWNKKYSDTLATSENSTGYQIGLGTDSFSWTIDISDRDGYKVAETENMYFPHKSIYSDGDGYWMASPSVESTAGVMYVCYDGSVNFYFYYNRSCALRPVVSLQSEIKTVSTEADDTIVIEN